MTSYKIVFKESVSSELKKFPKKDVYRILLRINQLADNPRPLNVEKLTNDDKYRIRQGLYRILYTIEDEIITVTIIKVGHRKSVYRKK